MAQRPAQSLKHEYARFIEEEIENYKESLARSALMNIGQEAVDSLMANEQINLTELLLCQEVDRIIMKRKRLPAFTTWRRKHLKLAAERKRMDPWGFAQDHPLVRSVEDAGADARVLVAGAPAEASALYLAANGCDVTAFAEADAVQRVIDAAEEAGLTSRVHASVANISAFTPDGPLTAVVYTPAAFAGMSSAERARVIDVLQSATADGGVHLVQTIAAGKRTAVSLDELRRRYRGWDVTVDLEISQSFCARKSVNELAV